MTKNNLYKNKSLMPNNVRSITRGSSIVYNKAQLTKQDQMYDNYNKKVNTWLVDKQTISIKGYTQCNENMKPQIKKG